MPLLINVGLSRKASRNYQSTGLSINITAELDQCLLVRPEELQQQIADLYAQAQQALDAQAQVLAEARQRPKQTTGESPGCPSASSGNGNGKGTTSKASAITPSQRRAILAIARQKGADPLLLARNRMGLELEALSIPQASELIDHLKRLPAAAELEFADR